tara:strand:- start:882 stop:1220 length:339 start_codon:yes stop_codon:yes gene_type:complete
MIIFVLKILFSALIISFASWLSLKKPILSGFIIALPLVSMITIVFSYLEHRDTEKTFLFTKSILLAIPLSLLFFVPFLFSKNFNLGFWQTYILGVLLLIIGFFIHKFLSQFF